MKYFLALTFIFFLQNTFFTKDKISYIHEGLEGDAVYDPSVNWEELNAPIYRGFDNGVYWFKLELSPSETARMISIPESHISRVKLFGQDGTEIQRIEPARYITFKVPFSQNKQTFYMQVNCLLEARIPIKVDTLEAYYINERSDSLKIGIYIGIFLAIVLFCIFSYNSFGNNTYILYVFMVVGLVGNAFYKDGLTAYLLGLNGVNEYLEPFINTIAAISAIFFTSSYLQIENQLKRLRTVGVFIVVLTIIVEVIYLFTGSFYLFSSIALLNLFSLTAFYLQGPILWRQSHEAKFFTIAYGILLFCAYDYYVSPHFGIRFLNLPLGFYKIGSILEMIIFTFAIMYQAKEVNRKNSEMRQELVNYTQKLKSINKGFVERPGTMTELVEIFGLTLKEIEVLKVLSLNKTNKEIAEILFISENTVKFHIKNICKKLGVNTKKDAKYQYLNFNKGRTV